MWRSDCEKAKWSFLSQSEYQKLLDMTKTVFKGNQVSNTKLKSHKSPGEDGIVAELLKNGELIWRIWEIITKVWETEKYLKTEKGDVMSHTQEGR